MRTKTIGTRSEVDQGKHNLSKWIDLRVQRIKQQQNYGPINDQEQNRMIPAAFETCWNYHITYTYNNETVYLTHIKN